MPQGLFLVQIENDVPRRSSSPLILDSSPATRKTLENLLLSITIGHGQEKSDEQKHAFVAGRSNRWGSQTVRR